MKMRYSSITTLVLALTGYAKCNPLTHQVLPDGGRNVSIKLFAELEELSRIVDISYCVGMTGISKPFQCASRCNEFPEFELVDTFNTGPLMSDSCGYTALDHSRKHHGKGRIIVAFRGTYSIANTIVDLSTVPQEYVPYPDSPENDTEAVPHRTERKCDNCTVHSGFWTSWQNTRSLVLPHIVAVRAQYPEYQLHLVGHSLGGAVAALAALEFDSMDFKPVVTTFGEPRVGNSGLRSLIDVTFDLPSEHIKRGKGELYAGRYRRVTHVDDPVPLLPLQEWGYRAHAGEVFISKPSLQPSISDVQLCSGDEDVKCIAGAEAGESWFNAMAGLEDLVADDYNEEKSLAKIERRWGVPIPARYKVWQLFFAHRDYFWRLGLCLPGGDPFDWGRDKYHFGNEDEGPVAKIDL